MKSISTPAPGNYEFLDEMGDTLRIKAAADGGAFILSPDSDLRFTNSQAPTLALAILTAAGVTPHHGTARCIGDRMDMWAVRYLTDHVEAQAEDAAEKELTRRRDELARELTGVPAYNYRSASDTIQRAIDMIIQLQDEASK